MRYNTISAANEENPKFARGVHYDFATIVGTGIGELITVAHLLVNQPSLLVSKCSSILQCPLSSRFATFGRTGMQS